MDFQRQISFEEMLQLPARMTDGFQAIELEQIIIQSEGK